MSSSLQYTYRRIALQIPAGDTDRDLYTGNFNYIYREDTGTDVNIQLNSRAESSIQLKSQTAIDIGSGGADKLIVNVTGVAVGFTLVIIVGDSEKSDDLTGVAIRRDSTETTLSGISNVNISSQVGADPLNVNISSQTGADPINVTGTITGTSDFNLAQINGSTTQIPYLQNQLTAFNGEQTDRIQSWSYLVTGQTQIYLTPASFDAYIRTINLSGFQLSAADSTAFLYIGNNVGAITSVLLTFTMNEINPAISTIKGTNTVSVSFPGAGLKLVTGQTLYIQGAASMWASGTFTGYRVPT